MNYPVLKIMSKLQKQREFWLQLSRPETVSCSSSALADYP